MTAESFACHDCPRRHAVPSSSGHGRSPGDHPSLLGLRPGRQLRQRATEGRPRQRRRATRTPPRHGTAATCALASFLVVVVQRGGRRFESCSYRQGGQCLAGRSPSRDTILFAPLSPCACQPSISSTRSSYLGARVVVGMVLRARPAPRAYMSACLELPDNRETDSATVAASAQVASRHLGRCCPITEVITQHARAARRAPQGLILGQGDRDWRDGVIPVAPVQVTTPQAARVTADCPPGLTWRRPSRRMRRCSYVLITRSRTACASANRRRCCSCLSRASWWRACTSAA